MVLRKKGVDTGEKVRIFKALQTFRLTPKPWVAGSNPPAPAKIIRTHSDECVLQSVEKVTLRSGFFA